MVLSTGEPGSAIVVDTGPDPDLLQECLDRLGVTFVPLVVLTHLHADHIDGIDGVFPGRRVGVVGVGPGRETAGAWRAVTGSAGEHSVPVTELTAGQVWTTGGARVEVLGPVGTPGRAAWGPNDLSVVLKVTVAGVRILMTGDIEEPAQRALLAADVDLTADVLKDPHHGSAALVPAFVDAVRARVAVIGVGRDNDFGHPTEAALNMLESAGVGTVLRTDQDGDVAVGVIGGELRTTRRGPDILGSG